jgi:glycerol-3-phosphate acyltransferase PlsY
VNIVQNSLAMNLIGPLFAYLIGAIPFGYLIFLAVKGIDIREVGSGNIGATNVGRNLGFRYFLLVFALDLLKGFLPTWGIPEALRALGASPGPELPVLVALAAILGHNFPVYLRFRGGKGVATSLGALLALDPLACGAAAVGFFAVFALTRFVSLSSIAGALAFVAGRLALVSAPWSPEDRPVTMLAVGIALLLIIRHHRNLARIVAGTEPRVPLRKQRDGDRASDQPSGRAQPVLLLAVVVGMLAAACPVAWIARRARSPIEANAGPWSLRETHREVTGQQRAGRVVFADHGRTLAVMCPRYNKILLYRVTTRDALELLTEIALEGRPVALATAGRRLIALERPPGDDKHLGPGWWQAFTSDGQPASARISAGYYPDDCAATPDGRFLIVLNSGKAEGDARKPLPGVDVFSLDARNDEAPAEPVSLGRLAFDASDDPERLTLSATGNRALVVLHRGNQALALDLSRPESPSLAGRLELDPAEVPRVSFSADGDWMIIPSGPGTEAIALPAPSGSDPETQDSPRVGYLAHLRPDESLLEIEQLSPRIAVGRLPIKGPLNLGGTRPSGLAVSLERGLLAVTTKPGTVHLIALRSRLGPSADPATRSLTARGQTTGGVRP